MYIEKLKCIAASQVSNYPQYAGHFDNYVLIKIKKDIKSKLGISFKAGELAIAAPGVREFKDSAGKNRKMVTAWSTRNEIDTSINFKDVEFI